MPSGNAYPSPGPTGREEPVELRPDSTEGREYAAFHAKRYAFLVETVAGLPGRPNRILNVGPSFETAMLRESFSEAIVDTLGLFDSGFSPRAGEKHIEFDLNDSLDRTRWPNVDRYDVVVAAEVIEHLYVPAAPLFHFLRSCLTPDGRLLVQTPNAVALAKRARMLAGRNPSMPLRPPRPDPGHVHEYTLRELETAATGAGMCIERAWFQNYFSYAGFAGRVYNLACELMPRTLRNGITVVFRGLDGGARAATR